MTKYINKIFTYSIILISLANCQIKRPSSQMLLSPTLDKTKFYNYENDILIDTKKNSLLLTPPRSRNIPNNSFSGYNNKLQSILKQEHQNFFFDSKNNSLVTAYNININETIFLKWNNNGNIIAAIINKNAPKGFYGVYEMKIKTRSDIFLSNPDIKFDPMFAKRYLHTQNNVLFIQDKRIKGGGLWPPGEWGIWPANWGRNAGSTASNEIANAINKFGDKMLKVLGFFIEKLPDGDRTVNAGKEVLDKTIETSEKIANKGIDATEKVANKGIDATEKVANKGIDATEKVANKGIDATKEEYHHTIRTFKDIVKYITDRLFYIAAAILCLILLKFYFDNSKEIKEDLGTIFSGITQAITYTFGIGVGVGKGIIYYTNNLYKSLSSILSGVGKFIAYTFKIIQGGGKGIIYYTNNLYKSLSSILSGVGKFIAYPFKIIQGVGKGIIYYINNSYKTIISVSSNIGKFIAYPFKIVMEGGKRAIYYTNNSYKALVLTLSKIGKLITNLVSLITYPFKMVALITKGMGSNTIIILGTMLISIIIIFIMKTIN
ncbi:MAG: hypothetical protein GY830_02725 [Bacteroidetes bacterium]|nr:hypothetical protein [Bacteroidota bacterium]